MSCVQVGSDFRCLVCRLGAIVDQHRADERREAESFLQGHVAVRLTSSLPCKCTHIHTHLTLVSCAADAYICTRVRMTSDVLCSVFYCCRCSTANERRTVTTRFRWRLTSSAPALP